MTISLFDCSLSALLLPAPDNSPAAGLGSNGCQAKPLVIAHRAPVATCQSTVWRLIKKPSPKAPILLKPIRCRGHGVLIARHENELSTSTDAASHGVCRAQNPANKLMAAGSRAGFSWKILPWQ